MKLTLRDVLKNYEGRKVRVGAYSAFLYFGISNKELIDELKKIDPGCMNCQVTDIYKSNLNDDIVIIYNSNARGRFWFEEEFKKAKVKSPYSVKYLLKEEKDD